jgi:hypothetical protein
MARLQALPFVLGLLTACAAPTPAVTDPAAAGVGNPHCQHQLRRLMGDTFVTSRTAAVARPRRNGGPVMYLDSEASDRTTTSRNSPTFAPDSRSLAYRVEIGEGLPGGRGGTLRPLKRSASQSSRPKVPPGLPGSAGRSRVRSCWQAALHPGLRRSRQPHLSADGSRLLYSPARCRWFVVVDGAPLRRCIIPDAPCPDGLSILPGGEGRRLIRRPAVSSLDLDAIATGRWSSARNRGAWLSSACEAIGGR